MAMGLEGIAINAWLVWILPFAGAAIIAAVARKGHRVRDYTAVGFALASAVSAATLKLRLPAQSQRRCNRELGDLYELPPRLLPPQQMGVSRQATRLLRSLQSPSPSRSP